MLRLLSLEGIGLSPWVGVPIQSTHPFYRWVLPPLQAILMQVSSRI